LENKMAEVTTPEAGTPALPEVKKMNPIELSALPAFARSRKGGYVEEEVDKFLKSFVADTNKLVDIVNNARVGIAQRDAKIAELQAQLDAKPVAAPVPTMAPPAPETRVAPPVPAPAPVAAPASDVEEETSERAARLFAEAQRVATGFIADAKEDAAKIVEKAKAEAEAHKATLKQEVADLTSERDELKTEAVDIIKRLDGLYTTQLESLHKEHGALLGESSEKSASKTGE
jgi:cell division septum initiation protein DivIVA